MQIPEGIFVTRVRNCNPGELIQYLKAFCGRVNVVTPEGTGFLLVNGGSVRGACYQEGEAILRGEEVVEKINSFSGTDTLTKTEFSLNKYTGEEFSEAYSVCGQLGLTIGNGVIPLPSLLFDDEQVKMLLRQPGVIAVSAIFEGFAVKSMGDANFDQIAAVAEDFRRAGARIAGDLQIGDLHQIILETVSGKLLITPYGDLALCILTRPDANLGLLRIALRSIQPRSA